MELPGQMVETQWDGYTIKEIISMCLGRRTPS